MRIHIETNLETAFRYFVGLRNEPDYNPQVRRIVKTLPEPIDCRVSDFTRDATGTLMVDEVEWQPAHAWRLLRPLFSRLVWRAPRVPPPGLVSALE